MNVAIRTDAAPRIGTGHVMRCLTLADALSAMGSAVSFLCRELPPHLEALITGKGHRVSFWTPRETTPKGRVLC